MVLGKSILLKCSKAVTKHDGQFAMVLLLYSNWKPKPTFFISSYKFQNLGFLAETYSFPTVCMLKLHRMMSAFIQEMFL